MENNEIEPIEILNRLFFSLGTNLTTEQEDYYRVIKQALEEKENKELQVKAQAWDRLTEGALWKDGKRRSVECSKIKNQYEWINYLSHLHETEDNDKEQLLRIVNHLDERVILWALDYYKEDIMRYKYALKLEDKQNGNKRCN